MPTEAIGAMAPELPTEATIAMDVDNNPNRLDFGHNDGSASCFSEIDTGDKVHGLHSPPDSNNASKLDGSDSELSDIEDMVEDQIKGELPSQAQSEAMEDDIGEILPADWSGKVPIFKPTMHQFKDFKRFMEKIDSYGMQSGIVKIVPPQEWKDSLPPLDDLVKTIRVREPIKQDIMGSNGTYRQVNILHQRSYNIPQWRSLCDKSEHQPPARRGERRANADKPAAATRATRSTRTAAPKPATKAPARRGRGGRRGGRRAAAPREETVEPEDRPITPVSPGPEEKPVDSVEEPEIKEEELEDEDHTPVVRRMGGIRQPASAKTQSVSARRKYSKREGSAMIDEAAFKDFDYRMDISDYTPERCEELEKTYWKTLTYAPPLYGADLMGTLFDESTELWNLNKLPNLLDVLGTKVPGVNTAYLYLGMWKATFAWHLEDVDLYSINYLHFGAPKQWYSISQADARRFEAAMKSIWPTEAKACDQFLRHKAFLISPTHLKQYYNITVNKVVSYPGEFVVTYPYGYHSGYNLGYNCAEAVNFALDSWLPMGKIAKRCECAQAQDSVWVDVYEIERKLRGESTEYEETEDEDEEEDEDEDNETGLPSPPASHTVRVKRATVGKKRKRSLDKEAKLKKKKIRLRLKSSVEPPCCLCPNDIPGAEVIPTDDGRKAHRMCALYVPETYIETVDGREMAANIANIDKARLDLKCLYCRSKRGACFQCSQKKCARSYHATCAAAAGVFVEEEEVPVFGEDGTEYKEQAFEFSCRFHRTKRDKKLDADTLDGNKRVYEAGAALVKNDICQIQYFRGDIFAGVVVENRVDEQTLLLDVIPNGDRVEVEYKWLLLPDPADIRLTKASPNALPLPTTRKAKQELNAKKRPEDELPRKDDTFVEGFTWSEFHSCEEKEIRNPAQVQVDFSKDTTHIWHYIGLGSTDTKAQYTDNLSRRVHNPKSNFLDSIPKPVVVAQPRPLPQPRQSFSASYPRTAMPSPALAPTTSKPQDRPYVYKPRKPIQALPSGSRVPAVAIAPGQYSTGPLVGGQASQAGSPAAPQAGQFTPQQFRPKAPPPVSPVNQQLVANQQRAAVAQQQQRRPSIPQTPIQPQLQQQQQRQPPPQQQQRTPNTSGQSQPQQRSAQQQQPYQHQLPQPQQKQAQQQGQQTTRGTKPKAVSFGSDPRHKGQYSQPQIRVWPTSDSENAGPRPLDDRVPMTSSDLEPNSSSPKFGPSGVVAMRPQQQQQQQQQPAPVYQKYTFFQVNHNRDSSKYRTPYNLYGGFTNGYEGNLKAFLLKAQKSLNGGKPPTKGTVPSLAKQLLPTRTNAGQSVNNNNNTNPNNVSQAPYSSPFAQHSVPSPTLYRANSIRGDTPISPSPYSATPYSPILSTPAMWDVRQPSPTPLHPAIRPQYNNDSWQSDVGEQTYGPHNFNPHIFPPQNHHGQHHYPQQQQLFSHQQQQQQQQSYVSSQYTPNLKPRAIAPYNSAVSPAGNRPVPFNKHSFSPIPLPAYVKRALSTSSGGAGRGTSPTPSSLLAQHSETLTSDPKPLSRHAVSQGGGPPSPLPSQLQQTGGFQMQRVQSDQGSFHEDNFFNFSAMDSAGSGGEDNGKNESQDNDMGVPNFDNYAAHNDGGQGYPDSFTDSNALVEKMMADLRRASTGEDIL